MLEVDSGAMLPKVAMVAYENSLTGLEFAYGIPGTIGGAVRMNAGAYGGEMKDVVVSTKYMSIDDMGIYEIDNAAHDFEYRRSRFCDSKDIIISTKLKLAKGNKEEIKEKMDANLEERKEKQPISFPNAGSAFKRGNDFITAKLIDECGLKGYNIGDIYVSDLHAGFILNKGKRNSKRCNRSNRACEKNSIWKVWKENRVGNRDNRRGNINEKFNRLV